MARQIDYPVVVDNDHAIWSAFTNNYWPALYFIDRQGVIQDQYFGEGRYQRSEEVLQQLLGVDRPPAGAPTHDVEAEADWANLRSPETYLGYRRSERFTDPTAIAFDASRDLRRTRPPRARTSGPSTGSGPSAARAPSSSGPTAPSDTGSTPATPTSCSHPAHAHRFPSASPWTERRLDTPTASTPTPAATAP